jgi:hypothetical protein
MTTINPIDAAQFTANGQLRIGGTTHPNGANATITAGTGITVTNGDGTITISTSGGGSGLQTASVSMTLANWTGMYATPFQIIAAPGSGNIILVLSYAINWIYGSANLASGGRVSLQYGNTVHGGGPGASQGIAAATWTAIAASTMVCENYPGTTAGFSITTSTAINTALYISNDTGAFTTGTGGSAIVNVNYITIAAT